MRKKNKTSAYDYQFCSGLAYGVSLAHVQAFKQYLILQDEITYPPELRLDTLEQAVCLAQEFCRYLSVCLCILYDTQRWKLLSSMKYYHSFNKIFLMSGMS